MFTMKQYLNKALKESEAFPTKTIKAPIDRAEFQKQADADYEKKKAEQEKEFEKKHDASIDVDFISRLIKNMTPEQKKSFLAKTGLKEPVNEQEEAEEDTDAKKLKFIVRKFIKDDGIGGARDVLHAAADALEWKTKLQAAKMIRKFIETKFDTI